MKNGRNKGLGLLVLTSVLLCIQGIVSAEITESQQQLIKEQIIHKTDDYVAGELIVGMNKNYSVNKNIHNKSNLFGINAKLVDDLTLKKSSKDETFNQVLLIKVDTKLDMLEVVEQLESLPEVEYAEPNYIVSADEGKQEVGGSFNLNPLNNERMIPNDPSWNVLWGLEKIGMPQAWDRNTGSAEVKVAVIDSGIDYTHEDLSGNVDASQGYDFVDDDDDPQDEYSHGTHVAGTIGAETNNGVGVSGINWSIEMIPLRVLDNANKGKNSNFIKAINWATEKNYPLANYSIGSSSYSRSLEDAIENYPGLFVASAGNQGEDYATTPRYPGCLDISNMITVGNSKENDEKSSSSNYSKTGVDLFAPGNRIYSTLPGNEYGNKSGTSMAAPHVTGSAALALSKNMALTTEKLKENILKSVDKKETLTDFCSTGGRLNTENLLKISQ